MASLTELNVYPLKSGSGTSLSSAELTPRGLRHDREFMLIDSAGRMLTQRAHPWLARLRMSYDGKLLVAGDFIHRPVDNGPVLEVEVWGTPCQGIDQGPAAAAWYSAFLDLEVRLIWFTGHRQTPLGGGSVGFADGYSLLVLSQESLDDLNDRLNDRLGEPVPMNRFRPNLVIEGLGPFGEDTARVLRVGTATLDLVAPCPRCVITTVDQETAIKGREPLRTLAGYRTQVFNGDRGIMFGQNAIPRGTGTLHVGDPVEILERA
ncbi:MAG: MOSC N-terminal beta barrel domain-containing protein [Streptosporangiaceae bacterium]